MVSAIWSSLVGDEWRLVSRQGLTGEALKSLIEQAIFHGRIQD